MTVIILLFIVHFDSWWRYPSHVCLLCVAKRFWPFILLLQQVETLATWLKLLSFWDSRCSTPGESGPGDLWNAPTCVNVSASRDSSFWISSPSSSDWIESWGETMVISLPLRLGRARWRLGTPVMAGHLHYDLFSSLNYSTPTGPVS